MRQLRLASVLVGGLFLIGAAGVSGQTWGEAELPRSGVCFYENPNFAGRYFCASIGDSTPMVPEGMNDRISSIRVLGDAEVAVYKDRDFRGESRIVRHDLRDLREAGLNDRISSFRVSAGGEWEGRSEGGDGEMRWGHPRVPRSGVCFYEHPNFGGRYFCAAVGDSAPMVPGGMNDRISSIRIFGRAEVSVFRDGSFRGEARRFGRDMPDLRGIGFNDRISSFRVDGRRPRRRY